nr:MAG TPA: hypothetical protein [Caudoviricetes sp.]
MEIVRIFRKVHSIKVRCEFFASSRQVFAKFCERIFEIEKVKGTGALNSS